MADDFGYFLGNSPSIHRYEKPAPEPLLKYLCLKSSWIVLVEQNLHSYFYFETSSQLVPIDKYGFIISYSLRIDVIFLLKYYTWK